MNPPSAAAATSCIAPPVNIWRAAPSNGSAPLRACFDWIEPTAHSTPDASSATTPVNGSPPCAGFSHGAASHATPASPSSSAPNVLARGRVPPGHAHATNAMASGVTPITSAVTPDGTVCSAHATRPLPPSSRKKPVTAWSRHCAAVGRAAPRACSHASSNAPASTNRDPAMRNGGMSRTTTRIARYVEPHTR